MRFVGLLLIAAGLSAQTLPEPRLTDLGDNHFTICSDKTASSGITNMRVTWTDDTTWTAAEWEQCHSSLSGSCTTNIAPLNDSKDRACVPVTSVKEGTSYLVHVNFWTSGGGWTSDTDSTYQTNIQASTVCDAYSSNCTDIDADGGGAGTDRVLQITTTSDGAIDTPALPSHTRTFAAVGTIDNEVEVTVTAGECVDLQAKITAQAAAYNTNGGAVTYAVKVPANVTCYPQHESTGVLNGYSIPDLTNTAGEFVLYSASPDTDVDPPPGGLIAPDAAVGALSQNLDYPSALAVLTMAGSGQQNFRLRNITLKRPKATLTNYTEIALTGWTDADRPEISFTGGVAPDSEQWGEQTPTVYFSGSDIESMWLRNGNKQINDVGASSWQNGTGATWEPSDALNPDEPGTTSTGVASMDITRQFTSATSGALLTFPENVNFASGFIYTLTASNSILAGVVSVDLTTHTAGHNYNTGGDYSRPTLLIEGATGDSGCNGLHSVKGVNAASGTWTIVDNTITCNGGTAQVLLKGWFHDLTGYTYDSMSCVFSIESQTTVQLYLCMVDEYDNAFVPDFTGLTVAGYMAHAPHRQPALFKIGSATGITVETVLMDSGDPPWISQYGIDMDSSLDMNLIVIGTRWIGGRHWQTVNPVSGLSSNENRASNFNYFEAIKCRACQDVQVINCALETDQGLFQSTNDANVEYPSDITVSGLISKQLPRYRSINASSGGIQGPSRQQPIEFKNGALRVLVEGLAVDGQRSNVTSAVAAFYCQIQTANGSSIDYTPICKDLTFRKSYVLGAQAFSVNASTTQSSTAEFTSHGPFSVTDILFIGQNDYSKPSGDQGEAAGYKGTFAPVAGIVARAHDVTIANNTFAWQLPALNNGLNYKVGIDISNLRSSSTTITDNVYVDMDADAAYSNLFFLAGGGFTWANYALRNEADGAISTLGTHSSNQTVACTIAPTTTAFDSDNAAHTEANARLTAAGGSMLTNWPLTPLSDDGQTCNERLDEVFDSGTWQPSGSDGADVEAIMDATGTIRAVTVNTPTSSGAAIDYTAPASDSVCYEEIVAAPVTTFADATGVTKMTSTTSKDRTATFSGLAANTTYDVQIQCDTGVPIWASFTTAP